MRFGNRVGIKTYMTYKSKEICILNDEYKVVVVLGGEKEVRKCLSDYGYPKDFDLELDGKRGMTYYSETCHPVIALPRMPKTAEEIGTLAHEAVHAVDDIMEHIREGATQEVFAHSVGAVVRGVLKWKKKKKRNM